MARPQSAPVSVPRKTPTSSQINPVGLDQARDSDNRLAEVVVWVAQLKRCPLSHTVCAAGQLYCDGPAET